MIKNRLLQTYKPWVQASQFGFRPKKSTSHAIFIARRRMDISERTGTNLTITLLDWKMAFDKVDQQKITAGIEKTSSSTTDVTSYHTHLRQPTVSCICWTHRVWISNSTFRNKTGMSFITLPYLTYLFSLWHPCLATWKHASTHQNNENQSKEFNTLKNFILTTPWFLATTLTISAYYWKKYKRNPAITIWN